MIHSLPVDLSLKKGDLYTILPIALSLVCFVIYWFTALSGKIKDRFYRKSEFDKASANHIFFTKIFGFFMMGIIPLVVCLLSFPGFTLADVGLTYRSDTILLTILSTVGLSLVVFPIASFSARKPKNLVNYPQIRAKVWTWKTVMITIVGWALYLFGYELLFRGVLLMPLAHQLGVWPAIFINIALYSATHVPKGLEETIGAAPLGLVLCLLTLATGTIWIAFLVHLVMAVTNCLTAMKFHPDIVYQRKSTR
jgi:membrane protease YdiL (CAAX protease family)